jgi:hypothetical protein
MAQKGNAKRHKKAATGILLWSAVLWLLFCAFLRFLFAPFCDPYYGLSLLCFRSSVLPAAVQLPH